MTLASDPLLWSLILFFFGKLCIPPLIYLETLDQFDLSIAHCSYPGYETHCTWILNDGLITLQTIEKSDSAIIIIHYLFRCTCVLMQWIELDWRQIVCASIQVRQIRHMVFLSSKVCINVTVDPVSLCSDNYWSSTTTSCYEILELFLIMDSIEPWVRRPMSIRLISLCCFNNSVSSLCNSMWYTAHSMTDHAHGIQYGTFDMIQCTQILDWLQRCSLSEVD